MAWDDLHDSKGPDEPYKGGSGGQGGGGAGGGGPRGPQMEIPQIKLPKFKPSTFMGLGILLLAIWILPGVFYFVAPDEEGVVVLFGKYNRTTQPGLHFKFPSPIEHVSTPKVRQVRRTEIGFRITSQGPPQKVRDVPAESLILTGDQNIVDMDLVIQYNIKDPAAYLFNVRKRRKLVRDSAETVLRGIVGEKKIDESLTTGKAEIQILIKDQMQSLLDSYESGIKIVAAQLQDVHPPAQVVAAFKDVVSAREDKERMINEAQGYRNAVIPEARGKAEQIIREAEAYKEEKIKRAQGDVDRFLAQYDEYRKAPEITRKRIYLETMEEILPQMDKFVLGSRQGNGVLPILPLGKNPLNPSGSK